VALIGALLEISGGVGVGVGINPKGNSWVFEVAPTLKIYLELRYSSPAPEPKSIAVCSQKIAPRRAENTFFASFSGQPAPPKPLSPTASKAWGKVKCMLFFGAGRRSLISEICVAREARRASQEVRGTKPPTLDASRAPKLK